MISESQEVLEIKKRFRVGVEQLTPFEIPDIFPILELLGSLERLLTIKIGEGYESNTCALGVRIDRRGPLLEPNGVRWN